MLYTHGVTGSNPVLPTIACTNLLTSDSCTYLFNGVDACRATNVAFDQRLAFTIHIRGQDRVLSASELCFCLRCFDAKLPAYLACKVNVYFAVAGNSRHMSRIGVEKDRMAFAFSMQQANLHGKMINWFPALHTGYTSTTILRFTVLDGTHPRLSNHSGYPESTGPLLSDSLPLL